MILNKERRRRSILEELSKTLPERQANAERLYKQNYERRNARKLDLDIIKTEIY